MPKASKIILIIALSLLVVGAVCIIFSVACGGISTMNLFQKDYTKIEKEFSVTGIERIVADLDITPLTVTVSEDDKVHITYYESSDEKFNLTDENGELRFESRNTFVFFHFSFLFGPHEAEIRIPASYAGDLSVKNATGGTRVNSLPSLGNVSVTVTTGSATVKNLTAKQLSVSTSTGSVTAEEVNCAGDISLSTSTGSATANKITAGGTFRCSNSTGSKHMSDIKAAGIFLSSSTGSTELHALDADEISITATTGSISGTLRGALADYTGTSGTSTGSNSLPGSFSGGSKKLTVKTSTGSIRLNFEQ